MAKLILHNDDRNSFPKVMASLIRFCDHLPMQAEQCVLIAHNAGKCSIMTGDYIELLDIKHDLENVNLKVDLIQ
jgi:ATP-dependent Clp protease adaptor protein ClpS